MYLDDGEVKSLTILTSLQQVQAEQCWQAGQ